MQGKHNEIYSTDIVRYEFEEFMFVWIGIQGVVRIGHNISIFDRVDEL